MGCNRQASETGTIDKTGIEQMQSVAGDTGEAAEVMEHEASAAQQVRQVLQRLLENRLFVKAEKCNFHAASISSWGLFLRWGR